MSGELMATCNAATPVLSGALSAPRDVSKYSRQRWTTFEGDVFVLAFMRTEHMFYCMRMLYDTVAIRHGWECMRPPGVGRRANPKLSDAQIAERIAWFATDITLRRDLDDGLRSQFRRMLVNLLRDSRYPIAIEAAE